MAQSIPQIPPNSSDLPRSPRKLNLRLLLVGFGAIGVLGYVGWRQFGPQPEITTLAVSGRIEADETDIQAKNGGQILTIAVREGDAVKAGQVLAQINAEDVQAQVRRSESDVQAAKQRVEQAQSNLLSAQQQVDRAQSRVQELDSRVREAQLNVQQSQGDSSGQIDQATAQVSAAQAQVSAAQAQVQQAQAQIQQAESDLRLARSTRDRYAKLVAEGAVGQQLFDQYQTAAETAQAAVETAKATLQARMASVKAAQDQLSAARGGLTQAQTKGLNPDIRNAQRTALVEQREQAGADLRVAQAAVQTAQAKLKESQADLNSAQARQKESQATLAYSTLKSPIDGVVLERLLEPGAVVTPQKTILTLINPQEIYLRGYVPEGEIGRVHVGMKARVMLDADPKRPLEARVTAIDPKASFTPENIYFKRDRVRQVFGLKLTIDQTEGLAKPGMPADAEILLKE